MHGYMASCGYVIVCELRRIKQMTKYEERQTLRIDIVCTHTFRSNKEEGLKTKPNEIKNNQNTTKRSIYLIQTLWHNKELSVKRIKQYLHRIENWIELSEKKTQAHGVSSSLKPTSKWKVKKKKKHQWTIARFDGKSVGCMRFDSR